MIAWGWRSGVWMGVGCPCPPICVTCCSVWLQLLGEQSISASLFRISIHHQHLPSKISPIRHTTLFNSKRLTSIPQRAAQCSLNIFSRMLRDSTPGFVGPSVRRSVRWSVRWSVRLLVRHTLLFCFFAVFGLTAPAQVIK